MANRVQDNDRKWRQHGKVVQRKGFTGPYVAIGVLGPEAEKAHEHSELTVVEVASYHEFGRGKNPERSFIRSTFDKQAKQNRQLMKRLADGALTGRTTVKHALELFGQKAVSDVKATMRAGIEPPKKDGTPARLIDTGQLISSVTYEVRGA